MKCIKRRLQHGAMISLLAVVLCVPASSLAFAETLTEALVRAYESNPDLRAQRSDLRATDEEVPQALSGWRPTVTAQGSYERDWTNPSKLPTTHVTPKRMVVELEQPIFRGFKTINSTRQAEAQVKAGRANLLATEQDVLFNTISAYMNVIRDRQIVSLREKNVSFLRAQLKASQDRYAVGEITRTDVSQSEAAVAQAQRELALSRNTLAASVSSYIAVIGQKPGKLVYPNIAALPKSLDVALAEAGTINPNILAAAYVEEAARYQVKVTFGDLLPSASLVLSTARTYNPNRDTHRIDNSVIKAQVNVPIYEAGYVYSSVRQAKQIANEDRIKVISAVRSVREGVMNAWSSYITAVENITYSKTQVKASTMARDGVRQEYLVGARTTYDVLTAEAVLINAEISLVAAERERVVAAYQILGSIGRLTAVDLRLPVEYYNPEKNYRAVRYKFIGTNVNTVE